MGLVELRQVEREDRVEREASPSGLPGGVVTGRTGRTGRIAEMASTSGADFLRRRGKGMISGLGWLRRQRKRLVSYTMALGQFDRG